MQSCNDCIRTAVEDPRLPTGRYGHSNCDYFCDKSDYQREHEKPHDEVQQREVIHRTSNMGPKEFALLQDTAGKVAGLMKTVYKPRTNAPKSGGYQGIK